MRNIRELLACAGRGILYRGEKSQRICELIEKTYQTDGLSRIMHLLECLTACWEAQPPSILSSQGFRYEIKNQDNDRLNSVYNYTFKNFKNKVELKDVAEVAGFIPNSFCRYFKNRTGKTYYQFLTETRIGYACKLLIDNSQSVKQICFESGFQNFSCFHKSFKDHTGYTPQTYQKKYLKSL
jgi:AraC-like DNA-binding protein